MAARKKTVARWYPVRGEAKVKLVIEPSDGVAPLVQAIDRAKSQVKIAIFRFDRGEIEKALANAVSRGVSVHALIAYTNRGGEQNLRKLEMRLLAAGVTVARTADDLTRYHGKYMIIDHRELHVLSFNFTHLDIDYSRGFGVITRSRKLVQEAAKLFEADAKRRPYSAGAPALVVSPVNARAQLARFIRGARRELLIYDPEISDAAMLRDLEERSKAGVEIKIIGRLTRGGAQFPVKKLSGLRLHTRAIIRDGRRAFIGSQSLRDAELGARREVGIIFDEPKLVASLSKTFMDDWNSADRPAQAAEEPQGPRATKVARKVAKAVAKELPPVIPVLEVVVKELAGETGSAALDRAAVEETVKDAVKEAVQEAVQEAVLNVVEQNGIAQQR
jgi:phosphatidylserine/phosphatidylglycerophosphate/cardiolipin synthase-like enzyme